MTFTGVITMIATWGCPGERAHFLPCWVSGEGRRRHLTGMGQGRRCTLRDKGGGGHSHSLSLSMHSGCLGVGGQTWRCVWHCPEVLLRDADTACSSPAAPAGRGAELALELPAGGVLVSRNIPGHLNETSEKATS